MTFWSAKCPDLNAVNVHKIIKYIFHKFLESLLVSVYAFCCLPVLFFDSHALLNSHHMYT